MSDACGAFWYASFGGSAVGEQFCVLDRNHAGDHVSSANLRHPQYGPRGASDPMLVWVVTCERDDDVSIDSVFSNEADADAYAAWATANPPLDGRSQSVHAPRYIYEVQAADLRTSFSPESPYG